MATSSSTNYNQTRNEIISDALALLGVIGIANGTMETPTAGDITFCSGILNKMVKAWQAQGIHLWKEREGTVFLREDVNTYTLSSSSTDKAGIDAVETTLSAAATSGASTITVTSSTGMSVSDNIGIELDDGTRQWTTISSISTTTITLATTLTDDAASGNTVFTYTTAVGRPLNITGARFRNADGTDRPVTLMGRTEFMQIPNKTTTGKTNSIFYSPQLSNGKLYVWPTPDDVADRLKISYIASIEDFDSSTDDPDFPAEWLEALTYNLAVRIAPSYGKRLSKNDPEIIAVAADALLRMQLWDSEQASIQIVPNSHDN